VGLFDGTALERPVICEQCGGDSKLCECVPVEPATEVPETEPSKQRLKIRVEKRKRGKLMTVVSGFEGSASQRRQVLVDLKNEVGAGGTLTDTQVEIQGDHIQRVAKKLEQLGFRIAKR
jgi:translation initiation factor 1